MAAPAGPDFEFLNSTPLDDVWSRAELRGSETGSTEHITVYTNIENPRRPFGSVYTLDEDNALIVDFATHSMRVRSSEFPLPNFQREYANAENLSFPGAFHDVAGTYECTTPPCTVSTANDGMISSAGDTWMFTPDSDLTGEIMIDLPDTDHLYFGWWLKEPADFGRHLRVQDVLERHGSVHGGRQVRIWPYRRAAWHGVVSRPGGGSVCDEGFHRWGAQRRCGGRVHRDGLADGEFRG